MTGFPSGLLILGAMATGLAYVAGWLHGTRRADHDPGKDIRPPESMPPAQPEDDPSPAPCRRSNPVRDLHRFNPCCCRRGHPSNPSHGPRPAPSVGTR